ncbi:LysM peptidoglycan-binding domain-containing protein [candidate division WWE3 bacterium]|nr:LysM peptidoglycan-binding domain-containing protein [candidate division WWE3 bacterium]
MNEEVTTQNQPSQTDAAVSDRSRMTSIFIGILLVLAAFLAYNFFQSDAGSNNGAQNNQNQQATNKTPTITSANQTTPEVSITNTPTESTEANQYIVQQGDTLWSIAEKRLNDGFLWKEIAKANNISDSSQLKVGETLTIPNIGTNNDVAVTEPTATPTTVVSQPELTPTPTTSNQENTITNGSNVETPSTAVGTTETYTVQRGDTLWSIAQKLYGDGNRWHDIFNATENHLSYRTGPNGSQYPLIHSGNVLVIPNVTK